MSNEYQNLIGSSVIDQLQFSVESTRRSLSTKIGVRFQDFGQKWSLQIKKCVGTYL